VLSEGADKNMLLKDSGKGNEQDLKISCSYMISESYVHLVFIFVLGPRSLMV